MKPQFVRRIFSASVPFLFLTGCNGVSSTTDSIGSPTANSKPTNYSCNPLGPGAPLSQETNGLEASLFYVPGGSTPFNDVESYINLGAKVDATLFFNQLNVPTRMYNQPFVTSDGRILNSDQGEPIYEWFGLEYRASIKLTESDEDGLYQFAVLSDDGSIFYLDQGQGLNELINNDGTHSSKIMCSTQTVSLDHSSNLPMKLDYYQGPRYNIAIMLLWRKITDTSDSVTLTSELQDAECGKDGGNTYYFDPSVIPSVPQQPYLDMLSRGWKVLTPGNFILPGSDVNPCEAQ